MKYSDTYSISLMCQVFHVPRASFYHYFYYSKDYSSKKVELLIRIAEIYYDSKKIYGAPRIAAVLHKEGHTISTKTVSKYMNCLEIRSIVSEKFPKKKSSMTDKEKSMIKNLTKGLSISYINQV